MTLAVEITLKIATRVVIDAMFMQLTVEPMP